MKNLTPFILIILAIGLGYFYTWPQWQKTQVLRAKQAELTSALEKAQEVQRIREELNLKYSTISPLDALRISRVVPARYDSIKLVADLNDIANRNSMSLKDVKSKDQASTVASSGMVEAPAPVQPYRSVEFTLSTEGQYKNFIAFIGDLEKSLQLLDIEKVTVGGSGRDRHRPVCRPSACA